MSIHECFKLFLETTEWKIPVEGFAKLGGSVGKFTFGVDEFKRTQVRPALFALVTVGLGIAADWAGSGNIAVGKKAACSGVIKELFGFAGKDPLPFYLKKEFLSCFMVQFRRGPAIIIEGDAASPEGIQIHPVIAVYNIAGSYPFFFSRNGNGNTVFVRTTYMDNIFSLKAFVSDKKVGRKIDPGKMAKMNRAVGIRKCCGDEGSLELRHAVVESGKVTGKERWPYFLRAKSALNRSSESLRLRESFS